MRSFPQFGGRGRGSAGEDQDRKHRRRAGQVQVQERQARSDSRQGEEGCLEDMSSVNLPDRMKISHLTWLQSRCFSRELDGAVL